MICDRCEGPIRLNYEAFVVDEVPIAGLPDHTLVTYMAHETCHLAHLAVADLADAARAAQPPPPSRESDPATFWAHIFGGRTTS